MPNQQEIEINAEKCMNCGRTIPAASQAFVYHDKVVCRPCKEGLDASTIPNIVIYIMCFAMVPAALAGFLEDRYHIFFRYGHDGETFIVFGAVAVFLFCVVLAVRRTVNKDKEKE